MLLLWAVGSARHHMLRKPELIDPESLRPSFPSSCAPASVELCFWLEQVLTALSRPGCQEKGTWVEVTQPGFASTVLMELETKHFHGSSWFPNPRENDFKLLTSLFFMVGVVQIQGFKKHLK